MYLSFFRIKGVDCLTIYLNNIKPRKIQLFIAKPDMTIVSKIKEAYNIKYNCKLTELSDLSFSLPFSLDNYLDLMPNENIPLIKEKYLIKMVFGNDIQWFEIDNIKDNTDNGEIKDVHANLLPFQLSDKMIRSYQVDSYNANDILTDLLSETVWGIGYIDSLYLTMYRGMDISSATVLDAVIQVGQTFNALIVWDTTKRTINLYQPQNVGHDTGMTFSYRKYLQSVSQETKTDGMLTRLKAYGKDSLTINEANPTGSSYLEDLSYFMYPFQQDDKGNVLQHSDYMSDELCIAIIKYNKLITDNTSNFSNLLSILQTFQNDITTLQNDMATLQNDMSIILNSLDVAKSLDDQTTIAVKIIEKNNKQAQIDSKQSEINSKQSKIDTAQINLDNLKSILSIQNNFTPQLIQERNLYIIEKEVSDDRIIDVNDLYKMAQDKLKELRTPIISATMSIVDFKQMVTEIDNWDRLEIGDTVRVKHDNTNIDLKAKITEISYDFEGKTINVTISNIQKTKSQNDMILDLLYKGASTSTTVDMNKYKWNESSNVATEMEAFMNGQFDATKNQIVAGVNNSVEISRKGIIIKNSDDPSKLLIAQNGVLAISGDFGNSWKNAIRWDGIIGEQIIGRVLIGQNLIMESATGGKFRFDSNGVTLDSASLTITGGIKESQLDPALKVMKTDYTYSNGIRIDTTNGIVVTKSNNKSKTILNATEGIKISKSSDGTNWSDVFFVDTNGNLNLTGNINMTGGTITSDYINLKGLTVKDNSNNTTFAIDSNGNTTIKGNITMTGGTITAPFIDLKGISVKDNSNNTTFAVDGSGNLTIRANSLTIGGNTVALQTNLDSVSSTASSALSIAASKLDPTQVAVYNALTNNGQAQGIYLSGGNLYINASYINSGYLSANMISGGTISGINITGTTITGASLQTGTYNYVWLYNNLISFFNNGSNIASIYAVSDGLQFSCNYSNFYFNTNIRGTSLTLNNNLTADYITANSSVYTGYLSASGNASVGGSLTVTGKINGTTVGSSDINFKKNINQYSEDALKKVLDTTVYTYHYNNENDNAPLNVGLIAQESPKEIVADLSDTESDAELGINLYSMSSVLWKAVQQQNELIEELKNEIELLKSGK